MEPTGTEMKALVSLLDDPDERVYFQIREKILTLGPHAVNPLERTWALLDRSPEDDLARERIEDILQEIHFASITSRLRLWVSGGAKDLLEGALIVCRYRYEDIDEKRINGQFDRILREMKLVFLRQMTPFEKIREMNHVLFTLNGFRPNKKKYHDPKNSYLSCVFDTKKGSPLSLAVIYQVLAERLSIPLRGVCLPGYFILAYMTGDGTNPSSIRFYLNPYSQGDVLDRKGVSDYLKKMDEKPSERFFLPCGNIEIIRRMLDDLLTSYKHQNDDRRATEIRRLLSVLPPPSAT